MFFFDLIPYKRFILSNILLFGKKFTFNKQKHSYFLHSYNSSFLNERAVEVPIIYNEVQKVLKSKNKKNNILEIGNVLSHYVQTNHTVVDKYEITKKVINEDALTFKSKVKFDLIVAISTFEHIGYDEEKKDSKKITKVINHLKTLLTKSGEIIFTIPIGYNKVLDQKIQRDSLPITSSLFLRRYSKINTWEETTKDKALQTSYNHPYPNANAIMIGFIKK